MGGGTTVRRDELVKYLDEFLEIGRWEQADDSLNGLQVEGDERVGSIAFAVDTGLETIELCIESGARMMIVHHGLFWGKPLAIVGSHRKRVKTLLDAGVSLYAAHLPLDFHPLLGHNVRIARALDLDIAGPLSTVQGLPVGTEAVAGSAVGREEFITRIEERLETVSHVLAFGPEKVSRVGICSGSGAKLLTEELSQRIDTFVTGETSHTIFHFAREYGVNVVFAGHYSTETPGLKALGGHLTERFGIETSFLEAPTGL